MGPAALHAEFAGLLLYAKGLKLHLLKKMIHGPGLKLRAPPEWAWVGSCLHG